MGGEADKRGPRSEGPWMLFGDIWFYSVGSGRHSSVYERGVTELVYDLGKGLQPS